MLNPAIMEAVKEAASRDAGLFWDEFQNVLNPAEGDWDAVSWGESQMVVTKIDPDADTDEYWELYQKSLVEQTERLSDEYDELYRIDEETWSTEVKRYHFVENDFGTTIRYPILKLVATDYSSDCLGIVDEPVSIEVVRKALSARVTGVGFDFGEWDGAEYPYIVCSVTVRDLTCPERLAIQTASDCGLEIVKL